MTDAEGQGLRLPGRLALVGCGKMGGALLRGWLARGVDPKLVTAIDINPLGLDDVKPGCFPIITRAAVLPADLKPAVLLLAVKPQFMDEALPDYRQYSSATSLS